MKIVVIGAGYVGSVTGACLASMGHKVVVLDKDIDKVSKLKSGKSPISEPGLNELLKEVSISGRFSASSDLAETALDADLVLVSVGTPTNKVDGSADLQAITRVFTELRDLLIRRESSLAIGITSTVPPGTTNQVARKILCNEPQTSGKFTLSFIPEFLREGTAISDFKNPSRFIVGVDEKQDADPFLLLRPDLSDRTHIVGISEAEMLKSVENAWHATKVVFANEIGRISEALDVDAGNVMDLLVLDTRQNISKTYLRPGFSFGGSCLPKDVRSLVRLSELKAVPSPLLKSLIPSNHQHIDSAFTKILQTGKSKIGILGLAFKADTDDIRESPALELIQKLLGYGFELRIHDFEALRHDLYGANLATLQNHAHIRRLMHESVDQVISDSEVIVITQHNKKYLSYVRGELGERTLIDLTGLTRKNV